MEAGNPKAIAADGAGGLAVPVIYQPFAWQR